MLNLFLLFKGDGFIVVKEHRIAILIKVNGAVVNFENHDRLRQDVVELTSLIEEGQRMLCDVVIADELVISLYIMPQNSSSIA